MNAMFSFKMGVEFGASVSMGVKTLGVFNDCNYLQKSLN